MKKHPLVAYYLLTFAISWGGFVLVVGPEGLAAGSATRTHPWLKSRDLPVQDANRLER